ncbi:hypothetical protein [Nitrosomonas sp.]|uniref:hypothetical protein n=1 Tax=Nitrosomonas sp. TaxID=42353 RepID=UPI00207E5B61|nr:hypothetical protein [Nitrosomonas sp.]GJL76774.1 MAG: hypothetical protein NMNS02_28800 [Nitrosomonas sp.]
MLDYLLEIHPALYLSVSFVLALWVWWYRLNNRIFHPLSGQLSGDAEQRRLNDLAARKQWIEDRHFETAYLNLLGRMLDWVAIRLTRDKNRLEQNRIPKGWTWALFRVHPFTEGSYLLCLRLALIYPWLAFFIVWTLGGSGELSGLQLLPDEATRIERWSVFAGFVTIFWFLWKFSHSPNWVYLLIVAVGFAFAGAGAGAVAAAVAFAAAVAVAVMLIRAHIKRPHIIRTFWVIVNLFYVNSAAMLIIWLLNQGVDSRNFILVVFIVLLPLINAFMDWLSLGFTRGFLYAIRQRTHHGGIALLFVVLDVLLALAFLTAIVSLTILLLAVINAAAMHWSGQLFMDLQVLFDGLAKNPLSLDYSWIHFMMLSTLIPTLIHFTVAGAAAVMVFPNQWRESILQHWDERGDAQTGALWYVTLVPVLGLIAPLLAIYGLYFLLSAHGGLIGYGLLNWARELSTVFDPLAG